MTKDKLKDVISENTEVLVQVFIQIALFCLVASSIMWNDEASLTDAMTFISVYFIAQVMTFNNMTGYGSKLLRKKDIYITAYSSFNMLVKSILKCSTASTYLPEFIEQNDKQKFEDDIKVALLPTFISFEDWKEAGYARMSDKEIMELSKTPKSITANTAYYLVEVNKVKPEHTDVKLLMSGVQKSAPKAGKKFTQKQKIAIKNGIRFTKYILTSVLYTYLMVGFDSITSNTISNYFIKSMPLIWTMMTAINFGKALEMDNIAEFNDYKLLLKQFIEWLLNVKKIELKYMEVEKNSKE